MRPSRLRSASSTRRFHSWLLPPRWVHSTFFSSVAVTTPLPQDFHLKTALPRMVVHLWPAALFLVFLTRRDDLFRPQSARELDESEDHRLAVDRAG